MYTVLYCCCTGLVSAASSDAADVIPQSDMVLIIVPAFAHRPILT